MRRLSDFAMFYLGWFACVVGPRSLAKEENASHQEEVIAI